MGFYRDKKRGDWIYRFEYLGKSYGGRGFKTKRDAEIGRSERRKELEEQPKPQTDSICFREVAYRYLDETKRRFAKKTHDFKAMVCKNFSESLPSDLPIDEITLHHIEAYLKTRPSNNNWNAHRKDLMALFQFALKRHYIKRNPVTDIEKMPHTPTRKVVPTEKQILQLINVCDPETELPLFLTILHTLGRVDEVLRLTWEDVNFQNRTVTLWTRKRKGGTLESDPMPMNDDLHNMLYPMYKKRTQNKWVFLNPKTNTRFTRRPKFMKGLCKRAFDPICKNVKEYTGPIFGFHHLRHFMASYLADIGKHSTKTLQRLLRHKEARTTEIYLHNIGDGIREAVKSVEGRFLVSGDGVGSDVNSRHQTVNTANQFE